MDTEQVGLIYRGKHL